MIDATSFMLGNLQYFYLQKQKDFIRYCKKKHTVKANTH